MERKPPQHPQPINDPEILLVLGALADPSMDFRTREGIAWSTGLAAERIGEILVERADLVRQPRDFEHKELGLYTLATRQPSFQERWGRVRSHIATW